MTKKLKPGQFYTIRGKVYRLAKRTDGCTGCVLKNPVICPGVIDKKTGKQRIDCVEARIIFKGLD